MCGYSTRSSGALFCFEYVSKKKLLGWPLVHVVMGLPWDPITGKIRIAKGIIAIGGGIAVGGLALGSVSVGIIALGGLALGLAALGGMAVGLGFAAGGLAIGFIAAGGCAIGYYAIGGGAFGVHALGGNVQDEQLKNLLERWHLLRK